MNSFAKTVVAVTLLLVPYIFATEPTLPPHHQYYVTGAITRPAGASLTNFPVVILAKFPDRNEFEILRGIQVQYERPVGLTDSAGRFSVVASSQWKARVGKSQTSVFRSVKSFIAGS